MGNKEYAKISAETRRWLEITKGTMQGDREILQCMIRGKILKYLVNGEQLTAAILFNKMRKFIDKNLGTYRDLYTVLDKLVAEKKLFKSFKGPLVYYCRYPESSFPAIKEAQEFLREELIQKVNETKNLISGVAARQKLEISPEQLEIMAYDYVNDKTKKYDLRKAMREAHELNTKPRITAQAEDMSSLDSYLED